NLRRRANIFPPEHDNIVNTREINDGINSITEEPSNPIKYIIDIAIKGIAYILNIIGSSFFYILWLIKASIDFTWRNLTRNENGPFSERIAGIHTVNMSNYKFLLSCLFVLLVLFGIYSGNRNYSDNSPLSRLGSLTKF